MLILALDTTTRAGSCALVRDHDVLGEDTSDASRPPAARLPADLMALLARAGTPLEAIDVFAVATGPGSFTGLRIGIATMQGLAFAMGKPLVGVSGLDALARAARESADEFDIAAAIVTWVDAWRGEVYAAVYEDDGTTSTPVVALPEVLLHEYRERTGHKGPTTLLFVGDGAETYRPQIASALGTTARVPDSATPALAAVIARMAREEVLRGHRPSPDAIRPLYVRRSDAELARDRS